MTDEVTTKGEGWDIPAREPESLKGDELDRWRALRERVASTARRFKWTKSEVTKRSAIPSGTFWDWYSGAYKGVIANVSDRVEKWLGSVEEMNEVAARVPVAPGFTETPTAIEVTNALLYAQTMPEMVVVTLGAGMGKTFAARAFADSRPHVSLVTMRPTTQGVHGMLLELGVALDVTERNPARLDRTIGERLKRNGKNTLLIVDEAQHLSDEAVNQLRWFLDIYGLGIALLGNEELYVRFGGRELKPAYSQIHRRIGLRLRRLQPLVRDVDVLLDAWTITDEAIRRLGHAIAKKPGALGQVTKTLQLAGMYAAGEERPMTAADVKSALLNRGIEEGH